VAYHPDYIKTPIFPKKVESRVIVAGLQMSLKFGSQEG
jgi:hypothetical protein